MLLCCVGLVFFFLIFIFKINKFIFPVKEMLGCYKDCSSCGAVFSGQD